MKNNKAAGTARELKVVHHYRAMGYVAFRTPASLGVCDVIAMKGGCPTLFIEVKARKDSPYTGFKRQDRIDLSEAASRAGAEAWLCNWPPHGKMTMIPEAQWPKIPNN